MKEKIRLVNDNRKLDYEIPVPNRLKNFGVKLVIRIEFRNGEFQYIPRKHTWDRNTRLSSDELMMIVKELERLNGVKK